MRNWIKKFYSMATKPIWLMGAFQVCCLSIQGQHLAAYHDNQNHFLIFDKGQTIQAEHLPVKSFSIGGNCLLYTDSRSNLKMFYQGTISTLEVNAPDRFVALDYLSVYHIGGIVKIIENGHTVTISTHAIKYLAEDSLVGFYDKDREMLAVYYKGRIHMLEDGLAGRAVVRFDAGDNLIAYISARTGDLKIFYHGESQVMEPMLSGGSFQAGRDILAWVNQGDLRFRIFYGNQIYQAEEFPPGSYETGDGIVAYVDHTGSFKVFDKGVSETISSFAPDFYIVVNGMVIYGEQGYFKVWYQNEPLLLETFLPAEYLASWNTIVYRDLNQNVKIYCKGDTKVLYGVRPESIDLCRDIVVINRGMNNHNVYYMGKKF